MGVLELLSVRAQSRSTARHRHRPEPYHAVEHSLSGTVVMDAWTLRYIAVLGSACDSTEATRNFVMSIWCCSM